MFLPGTKGQFVTREMGRVLGWKAPSIRLTGRWAAHAADGYARISGERGVVIGHGMEDALEILPALATPYGDLIPMTVALVVPDAELKRLAGAAGESVANQVTLLRYKKDLKKVENWPTLHLLLCGLRLPATVIAEAVRIASEPYVSKYKGSNPGPRYLNASKRPLIAMRSEILSTHNALEIAAFAQAIRAPVALLPGVTTEDPGKLQQLLDSAGLPLLYPASMVWSEAFLRADYIVRLRCNIHEGVMHGLRDFPLRARHEMYATPEIKKVRSDAASATKRERWVAALNRRQAKMKCLLTNYAHKLRRQRPVHPAYAAWRITENAPRDTVFVAEGNGTGMWLWSYAHGRTVVYPDRMATIGLSLAWLRGIREHEKHRPLWAVIGDGSLGYQVSLFEYLVDNDINCVVCVFNNSAWDSIRLEQTFVFRQRYPGTAREPRDYAAIASMNGCETIRVTSAVELDAALESARDWQEKRPLLLDIQTPADTIPLAGLTFALAELDYILTANILQAAISTLKAVWTGKLPLRLLWLAVRAYVL